ncbi:MAG: hypothetical protein IBX63_01105 [Coriobacteriia bacterium]|nr:hypothetical protein [Coriobacteriia bacterium]
MSSVDVEESQSTTVAPAGEPAPREQAPCRPRSYLPGWPFLLYLMVWAGMAAATVVLLTGPDSAAVPVDDLSYPTLLLVGLTLAACGPVLSLTVWLVARAQAAPECRGGLLTTALVRGSSATLFGVVAWWAALLLVDALRLGMVR